MSDNKRIAKNTGFLYIRMLLMMGIAFFSSRVLLRELGVDDFGIYGVVGGIVAMFSSLRGIFASSIQRFLNFEMGKGNKDELRKIFSIGVTIHILLSVVFLILAETVGLWFLNNKLVIASDRIIAANWVYQFSVISAIVTLMTVPYDAVIIANEKMKAFAYISILDAFLKLSIIFSISLFKFDKLIIYGALILLVSVITRTINMLYSNRNFEESKYIFIWDKELFKNMSTFAGWNFLGSTASNLSNEGSNVLLNMFGGTSVNAARAIAYQIRGLAMQLISNILLAVNPHLVKLYSQNKKEKFKVILFTVSKLSFFVLIIIGLPIYMYANEILSLWLQEVPEYTVKFVELIIIYLFIRTFHYPIDTLFKATGRIKTYQIIDASILFLNVPASYILLNLGFDFYYVFIVMIVLEFITLTSILILAHRIRELNIYDYLKKVIVPCLLVVSVSFVLSHNIYINSNPNSIINLSLSIVFIILSISLVVGALGLNQKEKSHVLKHMKLLSKKVAS